MYLTLRDRPGRGPGSGADRAKVSRVVLALGMVSLLTDVSSESVAAILPLYLTAVVGLSPVAYGFVDGLYQGVSALVRVGGGWASDRSGRPKWVAVVGYGLSAVARVFLLFASAAGSIATVVSADRIGKGIRTAPRDAMISSVTDTAHLGRAFGVHRTLDTLGAAAGPLLAFAVLALVPDGYRTVMAISLAFAVVGVALLVLLVPDVRLAAAPERPAAPSFRWRDLADPRLRPLLVVAGGLGLLTIGDGFIYLVLLDQGDFGAQWFPLLYVGTNIAYLTLAVPLGSAADRLGRARILVLGHLALVGAYLVATVPAPAAVVTILALVLLGGFYAATDGVTAAIAGRLVPVQARSSGIAVAQTVVAVARMLASWGFGLLWLLAGPTAAMVVVAGLLTGGVLVAFALVPRLDHAEVTA